MEHNQLGMQIQRPDVLNRCRIDVKEDLSFNVISLSPGSNKQSCHCRENNFCSNLSSGSCDHHSVSWGNKRYKLDELGQI